MSDFDVIIREAHLVTARSVYRADLATIEGRIAAIAPNLRGSCAEEIDASGLHLFPGLIDPHVHFNEPGRADWEGFETGSIALAAGGGTLFFDMPLNASPPTVNATAFAQKLAAANGKSRTDFAFWGGLVPGNLDDLEPLSECGVIGFKAFMSSSGIEDFARADDATLKEGMKRCARMGKLVAVHAESQELTQRLSQQCVSAGRVTARDYLESRPIEAELDAIQRALELAGETGCSLHIVHVSSAAGVELVQAASNSGVDVSCETCPHYLTLTEEDVERLGALAKCAPPLRSRDEQAALWKTVVAGSINFIGSDHSPAPPWMKKSQNFFDIWGGISGAQHTLSLLLTQANDRGLTLEQIAALTSLNIAERFRLPSRKGRLEVGAEADFALVDLDDEEIVTQENLKYRHRQSPYLGLRLRGKMLRTVLRGQTIFDEGRPVGVPGGRLVKPEPAHE